MISAIVVKLYTVFSFSTVSSLSHSSSGLSLSESGRSYRLKMLRRQNRDLASSLNERMQEISAALALNNALKSENLVRFLLAFLLKVVMSSPRSFNCRRRRWSCPNFACISESCRTDRADKCLVVVMWRPKKSFNEDSLLVESDVGRCTEIA